MEASRRVSPTAQQEPPRRLCEPEVAAVGAPGEQHAGRVRSDCDEEGEGGAAGAVDLRCELLRVGGAVEVDVGGGDGLLG